MLERIKLFTFFFSKKNSFSLQTGIALPGCDYSFTCFLQTKKGFSLEVSQKKCEYNEWDAKNPEIKFWG